MERKLIAASMIALMGGLLGGFAIGYVTTQDQISELYSKIDWLQNGINQLNTSYTSTMRLILKGANVSETQDLINIDLNCTLENIGNHIEILPKQFFLINSQGKYVSGAPTSLLLQYSVSGETGYILQDKDVIVFPRANYFVPDYQITIRFVVDGLVKAVAGNITALEIIAYDGHSAKVNLPQP